MIVQPDPGSFILSNKNMSDWWGALILILFLSVFLAQCHSHEEQHVGTARGRAAYSVTRTNHLFCRTDNKNNKVVYCCANQWPKPKCYDTFQECLAHCHARNLKFPSELSDQPCQSS
ncbi:hypothetical protein SORBI_3010G137800 [Sorghum bicolor]|uniref:Uncharacterized protein n=1 Tax=Sorghum bicolor TaxID=4558 RepID=A0A194YK37_SORBI|nr:hypothetical protein SORBI_3010G137800 [Sorghum bicolor]